MAKYTSGRQKNLKVGIPSYSEDLTSVEVIGGATFTGESSGELVRISQIGTGPAFVVEDSANPDTTPFAVTTDGRVAIGVAVGGISSSYKLEVDGNGNGGGVRFVSGGQGDLIFSHSNLVSNVRAAGDVQLGLGANGGDAIRINLDNNVGLGSTNPTSKLYVVGDGYFIGVVTASNFYVGNSLIGGGSSFTELYVSGVSTFAGITTHTTSLFGTQASFVGVITANTFDGTLSGYATSSGIATYATNAGIATYATNAGIATYATNAGIATYATNAGIATYATNAGVATYATNAGIATYATNAGIATALQNSRTFEITGDIVASPISFNGTGNVSLAATIQPNSVALGSDTTGDYVQSVTGTSNQISVSVTSGEGSTPTLSLPIQFTIPQDATVTRDLQVNRNLNVTGNITLGGTTAFINAQQLKISDPDIILGVRTDGSGNDISNDTTASHGGVAVASTEGNPLVNFNIAGIETLPPTYKKIMWFKSGAFSGLGTDAWLINYAVGIGSTQFPNGTRLAAGSVQFTERDLAVVRNINASGVITATSGFSGNASSATYAPSAGIATYATSAGIATYAPNSGVSTSVIGGIGSITQLQVTGVSTTNNLNVGIGGTIITTTTAGLVGIGTTNPLGTLQVGTGITMYGVTGIISATSYRGDGSQLSGISAINVADDTLTNATRYILFDDSTGGTVTTVNVSTTKLTFNPSTGNMVVGGTVTANSDEKLKTNIKTIDNALDKVLSLRGVEYDRIDNGDHQIGVIAQEVEKIIPDVVYPKQPAPDYETKSVAYANLVGLLIEAIKEQNVRMEELERKLEEK
jgi:hypothetical protein